LVSPLSAYCLSFIGKKEYPSQEKNSWLSSW
jgi:hypothetical protein